MIFSRKVYDAQFSFVGKCMMPSVLKICSDFKSRVVYSSLKGAFTPFSSLGLFGSDQKKKKLHLDLVHLVFTLLIANLKIPNLKA